MFLPDYNDERKIGKGFSFSVPFDVGLSARYTLQQT